MERKTDNAETQTSAQFISTDEFLKFQVELQTTVKKLTDSQALVKKLRSKMSADEDLHRYNNDREKKATADIIILNRQVESMGK